ncbi:putative Endonuclease-reverse transcriptase/Reverse transcriptase (RNA-dependent DNA polymerase) [Trypanosoma cruzi]|uniref:Putative Endonuclease-reverse transcriptase/Reverse transcriptase (RNA-dependent DNA polymerase) n=1 Tax=Trypanosoma cruzi TaxID=5693 RepID=A0A2V2W9I9_TRYCR|nr:putative Endonuclease-reverse transcriptase/Reverse transcriptase (RNA-dependent DNA polymerase) [Trypanosoma cruzi]
MREVSTTRQEAALFNAVFSEKNALNSASTVRLPVYGPHSVPAVTVWEVRWALQQLRPTSAPDNDGIFFWLPQTFGNVLEPRLARADTKVLRELTNVLAFWKRCAFILLFKPEKAPDATKNDRPVRITSSLSSVCERVFLERALLATHGPMCDAQYGFPCCRTTVEARTTRTSVPLRLVMETPERRREIGCNNHPSRSSKACRESTPALLGFTDGFCRASHRHIMNSLRSLGVST